MITTDMISHFEIFACYETFPGFHKCEVTLTEDRKVTPFLEDDEIYVLINSIAKEKIVFSAPSASFKHFSEIVELPAMKEIRPNGLPTVENVLAKLAKILDQHRSDCLHP